MTTVMQRWNARRAKPGDGSHLPRYRWWHMLGRSVFELPPRPGAPTRYAVDVRPWGDRSDGVVRARLYRDGKLAAVSKLPTAFEVEGGTIEVAVNTLGLRRCHFVPDNGPESVLDPIPASAEGRRARLAREHPTTSRVIGALALVAVLAGAALGGLQLVALLSTIPAIGDVTGVIDWPRRIPLAITITVGAVAVLGAMERTLRLRSSWLDQFAT